MANPRAIYFNDEVSVGYIRGAGMLEIVAQDARLGSIFYVVHQDPGTARRFGRESQCLRCHLSWDTLGVPGLTVLSTMPRKSDRDYASGFFVDHYRQIQERWGGWYVTGKRVPAKHMGNLPLITATPLDVLPPARASLEGQFDLYRLPHTVQRHRGADGARSPGALQQSRDPRHVGSTPAWASKPWRRRRAGDAHRRSGRDPRGLPAVRGRGADHRWSHRGLVRIRGEVRGAGEEGRQGPLAARARSEDAAAEVSAQLHDLFAAVSGLAGGAQESRDGTHQRRAVGKDHRRQVRASHA